MAFDNNKQTVSLNAGSDLSTKQFYFMQLNSSGLLATAADGSDSVGVLQDKPDASGRAGQVCIGGITRVACGGSITKGGDIASDTNGKAVAAATGDIILGVALDTGASGNIIPMLFEPRNARA